MPGYAIEGSQNAAAATTILGFTRGAAKRIRVFYLTVGSAATPADQANNMMLVRSTAAGTSTAVTPRALDPADGPAVTTAGHDHTVEPTYTADSELLSFSFNTRANYQWYANPGRELVVPDTALNGLGLRFIVATGTQLHEASLHFEE